MASLIARVTSTGPQAPLSGLVDSQLGLDVWELDPEYPPGAAALRRH